MFGKSGKSVILWVIIAVAATGVIATLLWPDTSEVDFDDDGPRLVYMGILVVFLLASLIAARPKFSDVGKAIALWGALGLLLVIGYAYRAELTSVGNRTMAVLVPGYAVTEPGTDGSVSIYRSGDGHFSVRGRIDGRSIAMLVDTGASGIVLSDADARAIGIDVGKLSFTIPISTANGRGRAARVRLSTIEIGDLRKSNFNAFVLEPGKLRGTLLGMDFLDRLSRWEVRGDRMILYR